MRIGCSAVPQGAGIIPIRKLRKIGAFQSVPYHTVPVQELNTKAFEKQLAGCIVFQLFFRRAVRPEAESRKSQGKTDWKAPDNRPGFARHILEALPGVSKGAAKCFGIGKGLRFEQDDGL